LLSVICDDTKLLAIIKDSSDLDLLQQDIDNLVKWSKTWHMCFNEEKCKVMFIERKKCFDLDKAVLVDPDENPNWETDQFGSHRKFTMCSETGQIHILSETTVERDLGILVDNRLLWHHQIENAKKKAFASLNNLKRAFQNWTPHTFKILYVTFVRPHLEYCATIWFPYTDQDINSIESVQKYATRLVPTIRSLHYVDRLKVLGLTTLAERRNRGDLIQYYKIHHKINEVNWINPNKLLASSEATGPASNMRGYAHRLQNQVVNHCQPREFFLSNRIVPSWNQLPPNIIASPTTNSFKNNLDKFLITNPNIFNFNYKHN
jgi:hypothetical protein